MEANYRGGLTDWRWWEAGGRLGGKLVGRWVGRWVGGWVGGWLVGRAPCDFCARVGWGGVQRLFRNAVQVIKVRPLAP